MPLNPNMKAIETVTVPSGGASSITFSNIPQTYTDLKIVISARNTVGSGLVYFSFNGNASSRSSRLLYGDGSAADSVTYDNGDPRAMIMNESGYTTSTFASGEMYIPNYTGSNNKSFSADSVQETNATTAYSYLIAGLWSNTSAITSIALTPYTGNFAQYSTATLYGVLNYAEWKIQEGAKARGGIVTETSTHWIHSFYGTGTFTPTQNLTADYLVVAGGGGGGGNIGGGGGAGGVKTSIGGTALSLSQSTGYIVTAGAGGAGGNVGPGSTVTSASAIGNNSSISGPNITTITSTGGGRGGDDPYQGPQSGGNGGSGGGGASRIDLAGTSSGGTGNSGEGNNGGSTTTAGAAGGGGAGGVGGNGAVGAGGAGGAGIANSISGSSVTYGGGGGGGGLGGVTVGAGGSGGGGSGGGAVNETGTAGTARLGGGGGGGGGGNGGIVSLGGAGGSGIVIIRYPK